VDLLESQGYLKILMNPTLEVVNGKTAKVSSSQKVPIDRTFLRDISGVGSYIERTEWENVVDSLQVTPHVFMDGSIGLETNILLGSKLTPEGIKQVSIITKKEIDVKENRIRPGESLIIGGLRKIERRDVIRGIPFLKDIPLIGIFFSGRDFEERAVETIFILTPSISTGGIPREEMVEDVERKHGKVGLKDEEDKTGIDLFGTKARKKEQQRKLEDAEQARLEAEAEKAKARSAVREADDKAKRADSEVKKAMAELEKVKTEALQIKADAEKAKAAADKAEAKSKTADQPKAKTETEKPKAEAEKEKTEPEA
jgi:type II secretory pathway component GspD/PulD (secretin)